MERELEGWLRVSARDLENSVICNKTIDCGLLPHMVVAEFSGRRDYVHAFRPKIRDVMPKQAGKIAADRQSPDGDERLLRLTALKRDVFRDTAGREVLSMKAAEFNLR
jgi:hypothetical protein